MMLSPTDSTAWPVGGDGRSSFTWRGAVSLSEGTGVMTGFWRAGSWTPRTGRAGGSFPVARLGHTPGGEGMGWGTPQRPPAGQQRGDREGPGGRGDLSVAGI